MAKIPNIEVKFSNGTAPEYPNSHKVALIAELRLREKGIESIEKRVVILDENTTLKEMACKLYLERRTTPESITFLPQDWFWHKAYEMSREKNVPSWAPDSK